MTLAQSTGNEPQLPTITAAIEALAHCASDAAGGDDLKDSDEIDDLDEDDEDEDDEDEDEDEEDEEEGEKEKEEDEDEDEDDPDVDDEDDDANSLDDELD
jgi:hypothetical protein